jgi:hypothetical protein
LDSYFTSSALQHSEPDAQLAAGELSGQMKERCKVVACDICNAPLLQRHRLGLDAFCCLMYEREEKAKYQEEARRRSSASLRVREVHVQSPRRL